MMHTKKEMKKMVKEFKRDTGKVKGMTRKMAKVDKAAQKHGF